MDIFYIFILLLLLTIAYLFYFYKETYQNYSYGNLFCGKQDLCISQRCLTCGLRAPCEEDIDCGPNRCIEGCCDNM